MTIARPSFTLLASANAAHQDTELSHDHPTGASSARQKYRKYRTGSLRRRARSIGKGHSTEVDPKRHPLSLDQFGQLQIGIGQREGHLLVAEKAFSRMIECPLATFPPEHHALTPVSLERFTSLDQVLDETVNGRVVQVRAYVVTQVRVTKGHDRCFAGTVAPESSGSATTDV